MHSSQNPWILTFSCLFRLQIQALDNEVEFNEQLIAEREEDLKEIERSILEVNEIFRDLGTLVHEQGHMLGEELFIAAHLMNQFLISPTDNIESNVQDVTINMENATGELRQASKWQKSTRNKLCCLMLIFAVIAVVLILILT